MSRTVNNLFSEDGVAAVETPIVFFIVFLIIMMTYELLKYQSDISLIYINEALATERMDMALLGSKPDKLTSNYLSQLNSTSSNGFFNALQYSGVSIECYQSLNVRAAPICNQRSKILKISYNVERRYVNKWLCRLGNLPVTYRREVLAINDYYH